jgi:predicted nuclease of predicted toxin-antitoxin system
MIIWIDAQLPPAIAVWIQANFPVEAVAVRDLGLCDAEDAEIFAAAKANSFCNFARCDRVFIVW